MQLVFLAHLAATLFMTGVIWFVQIVHYPLFAQLRPEDFVAYERAHVTRTGWIVGPPMLVEVATGAWLLLAVPAIASHPLFLAAFALLVGIWIATATLSVPAHHVLSERHDLRIIRRLIAGNWLRTAAWTARSLLLLTLLFLISGQPPAA